MRNQNPNATRIFVVEDDVFYQKMLRYLAEMNPDHEVFVFSSGEECLNNLNLQPDIISLDYTLPKISGEEVLQKIKRFNENIGVLILSGQQDIATAVHLLKQGADDYITKDQETKERFLHALEKFKKQVRLEREVENLRTQLEDRYQVSEGLVGNSAAMQQVYRLLEKAAKSNITVSVTGETGTGKEMIARQIHYNSARKKKPFVAVNMSAIPANLLESELFGYEKGAFTGANARKKGQFELADGGTLFLDEIAEIELPLQAKLLRALQEFEFTRLGGEKTVSFDARIVIATHKDLADEVRKGNFREDLYYRLLGLKIDLPPLRQRDNDIIQLAEHFLSEFCQKNKMKALELTRKVKKKLLAYSFPGNVRELKAIIDLAAVMSDGKSIREEDIQFQSLRQEAGFLTQEMTMEEYKHSIINHFLAKYDNDVLLVADKLNIGKSTIYRYLKAAEEIE